MKNVEKPEEQPIQPSEQEEGERRESQQEEPRTVETVEGLGEKIAGIDERIDDNIDSIEETSEKLTAIRDKLDLPPMTSEAPSITEAQGTLVRLEAEKQDLVGQRETLGGEVDVKEKPKRLEDDPRYKELLTHETHAEAFGGVSSEADRANEARRNFERKYPEEAKVYRDLDRVERKQAEEKRREAERPAQEAAKARENERIARERKQQSDDAAFEERRSQFKVEKGQADVVITQADETRREESEASFQEIKTTEAERSKDVGLKSFDSSIDDFIKNGVISDMLGEQLKAKRRLGAPSEQNAFDEAVGQVGYDFRIKQGSPNAVARALTDLNEGRSDVNQTDNIKQPEKSTPVSEVVTSDLENTPVDRASAADQQNVRRGLENLWANSGLSDNRLIQLREKIASGSAEEVNALNTKVLDATRMFARTRNVEALSQMLMRLATQGQESVARVDSNQNEASQQ